jgi:hypothetical protein
MRGSREGPTASTSQRLAAVRRTLGALAADFNPYLVTPAEASVVADEAVKIQSIASVVKDFATSRSAGTQV